MIATDVQAKVHAAMADAIISRIGFSSGLYIDGNHSGALDITSGESGDPHAADLTKVLFSPGRPHTSRILSSLADDASTKEQWNISCDFRRVICYAGTNLYTLEIWPVNQSAPIKSSVPCGCVP